MTASGTRSFPATAPRLDRRSVSLGLAGSVAALSLGHAQQSAPTGALAFLNAVMQDGARFDAQAVTEAARLLSRRPYVVPNTTLPDPFNGLTHEAYQQIRHRPERMVWADEQRSMLLEPLHRGFAYQTPVLISVVEDSVIRRVVFDTGRYAYGRLTPPANLADIGFSGFRLHERAGAGREVISFQGGTSFRATAKGQVNGVMARALAIKTADSRGEEFPIFRAFWVERPGADGVTIIHAVADSESATAAFRFVVRPGDITIVDTEATIFARTAIDHLGLGAMQGSFLHGHGRGRALDDVRPSAHDASGAQMLNGRGEWIWRPLKNPSQLQISSFMDENPRGFGLIQRDRDFGSFMDDDNRFDLRPSLWIEPIGEWGPGQVQLVEIPSDADVNDNVIAYWRPRAPLAASSESTFAYRQFWCWLPPEKPGLAQAIGFRMGRGSTGRRRRCLVEFAGESLAQEDLAELRLALTASPGAIHQPRLQIDAQRKTARVLFELDPGSESACELRLQILKAERLLTETWLYRWTS